MATRPRRHSVVTLRLTVTPDDVFSGDNSPTLTPRSRHYMRSRGQNSRSPTSPLHRTPSSPSYRSPPSPLRRTRTPPSPLQRIPTSPLCRTPVSPHGPLSPRKSPSPLSPRSGQFKYDSLRYISEGDNAPHAIASSGALVRRSSLLTVPATEHEVHVEQYLKPSRQRSSSLAAPMHSPDMLRFLSEVRERGTYAQGVRGFSIDSSDSEDSTHIHDTEMESIFRSGSRVGNRASPLTGQRSPTHHQGSSTRGTIKAKRPLRRASRSSYRSPSPHSPELPRTRSPSPLSRKYSLTDAQNQNVHPLCRMRQFTTSKGRVVNRGDSFRPQRSGSNASMTSTISNCSREFFQSYSNESTTSPARSPLSTTPRATSPNIYTDPNAMTPTPAFCHRVATLGAVGVGRAALITQFMTSEYMCAYDDSQDVVGSERSISVMLDGEEAELLFIRGADMSQISKKEEVDAWVVVYSVCDRASFRQAAAVLGKIWTSGLVPSRAVILVGNKTDLERKRIVSTVEGRTLAKTYECKFIEVSAGIDHNVDELLVGIIAQIRLKRHHTASLCSRSRITTRLARKFSSSSVKRSGIKMPGIVSKLFSVDRRAKSCENLHTL